jgi:hypothetical protein
VQALTLPKARACHNGLAQSNVSSHIWLSDRFHGLFTETFDYQPPWSGPNLRGPRTEAEQQAQGVSNATSCPLLYGPAITLWARKEVDVRMPQVIGSGPDLGAFRNRQGLQAAVLAARTSHDAQMDWGRRNGLTTPEFARPRTGCASQGRLRVLEPLVGVAVKEEKHQFRRTDASQWWLRPASIR